MMNKLMVCLFLGPLFGFSQEVPSPNFEQEFYNKSAIIDLDFKQKPYKSIAEYYNGKLLKTQEFDQSGHLLKNTITSFNDFLITDTFIYKDDLLIEKKYEKVILKKDDGTTKRPDLKNESTSYKVTFDTNDQIINGISSKITNDTNTKILAYTYYDKDNRIIKSENLDKTYVTEYFYAKNNLTKKETTNLYKDNVRQKIIYSYNYNKDNQITAAETIIELYKNDILTEKKVSSSAVLEYKNKRVVKKTLNNQDVKIREYKFDSKGNLVDFSEKGYDYQNNLKYEKWRKFKYVKNILIQSEDFDGTSTHSDGQSGSNNYYYNNDGLLKKTVRTFNIKDERKMESEYFYNEFKHLIRTENTIVDIDKKNTTEYKVEYF
jgi:hypothetical protein